MPIEDSRTTKVITLDDFGKNSMVFSLFMVNFATCFSFCNFTYTFAVRDCNPIIYNASIHPIYPNVYAYEVVMYNNVAISIFMKIISVYSYYKAL